MIERLYVEIGNICNLSCSFCPKTTRKPRQMSVAEFEEILIKVKGRVKYIYLHVLGEPLCHPRLGEFLSLIGKYSLRACVTTNGTLLPERGNILLEYPETVHKVSVSLHAPEGNGESELDGYLSGAVRFARSVAERGIYTVFRLWNEDSADASGKNLYNSKIEAFLDSSFPEPHEQRRRGVRLAKYIFLEYDGAFVWPKDSAAEERDSLFCHAMKDQLAILADGTVVPCCLDGEGMIPLGNIFESALDEILSADRAKKIKDGFRNKKAVEPLCKRCTYARRFSL